MPLRSIFSVGASVAPLLPENGSPLAVGATQRRRIHPGNSTQREREPYPKGSRIVQPETNPETPATKGLFAGRSGSAGDRPNPYLGFAAPLGFASPGSLSLRCFSVSRAALRFALCS